MELGEVKKIRYINPKKEKIVKNFGIYIAINFFINYN